MNLVDIKKIYLKIWKVEEFLITLLIKSDFYCFGGSKFFGNCPF